MPTRKLKHDEIEIDGGTQVRAEINYFIVNEYADAYRDGAEFPPLVVYHDGVKNWLSDGFHRFHASKEAGVEKVECEIRKGSKRDAIWDALSKNQVHGLRRTNADKNKAVLIAIKDKEWTKMSDNAIAEHIGVSQPFVSSRRNELISVISSTATNGKRIGRDGKSRRMPPKRSSPKFSPQPVRAPVATDDDEPADPPDDTDPKAELRETARQASWTLFHALDALGISDRWQATFKKIRDEIAAA